MKKFDFIQTKEIIVTETSNVTVEANTYEEALAKFAASEDAAKFDGASKLDEDSATPIPNGFLGRATRVIYDGNDTKEETPLWDSLTNKLPN